MNDRIVNYTNALKKHYILTNNHQTSYTERKQVPSIKNRLQVNQYFELFNILKLLKLHLDVLILKLL